MKNICTELRDEEASKLIADKIAKVLSANLVIYLQGELGSGKTTLVRYILQALNYKGRVKSPTYTLVEDYSFENFTVHHFDLYRFNSIHEWNEAGLNEMFCESYVCFIEWPNKAQGVIPAADLDIQLELNTNNIRQLNILAKSDNGTKCLNQLITLLDAD